MIPDNYVDRPNLAVLVSPSHPGFWGETFHTFAWLRYLWTGPNPNIEVDLRKIYPDVRLSAQSIYESILAAVDRLRIPGVFCGSQILHESGPFSPYRAYLSVRREFGEFLVCAAPVGEAFVVTVRKIDYFPHIRWFHYIPFFLCSGGAFLYGFAWDEWTGAFIVVALPTSLVWSFFRYAASSTLNWFSKHLPHIPFIGHLYMRWFRPDTYYRQDVNAVFLSLVDKVIGEVVAEMEQAQAIRPVTEAIGGPIRRDLHSAR